MRFRDIHRGRGWAQCIMFNKSVLGNTDLEFSFREHHCNHPGKVKFTICYWIQLQMITPLASFLQRNSIAQISEQRQIDITWYSSRLVRCRNQISIWQRMTNHASANELHRIYIVSISAAISSWSSVADIRMALSYQICQYRCPISIWHGMPTWNWKGLFHYLDIAKIWATLLARCLSGIF